MKVRIKRSDSYIFITILLLTLSNCYAFVDTRLESLFEAAGYVLLLGGILFPYFFKTSFKYRMRNTSKMVVILSLLLLPGILMQQLPMMRKMTIIVTVLAIIIVSIMSENYITDYRKFRVMAYACLAGIVISIVICAILEVPLIRYTSEPVFGMVYFFNGGIRDKNVATMMIAVIMSLYICYRESGHINVIDKAIIAVSAIVIFLANSRGAWVEFIVFLLMLNYKQIGKFAKTNRWLVVLIAILIIVPVVVLFYNNYVMKSETYLYRYRGLMNYLKTFSDDRFHMLYGNADLAYGSKQGYAIAVRSVIGWNGTIENAWLNILIKSGLLGVLAYILLFARAIITAIRSKNLLNKTIYLAVTITLISSSFVAIYIQTVHGLFGVYCYLIMAYYSRKIRTDQCLNKPIKLKFSRKGLNFGVTKTM